MANGEFLLSEQRRLELGRALFARGLFGVREHEAELIRLKSGRLSPHYLDIRRGLSDVIARDVIADGLAALYESTPYPLADSSPEHQRR